MQPGVPHSHQSPTNTWPASATGPKGTAVVSRGGLENQIGTVNMQTTARNNLFPTDFSSSFRFAEREKQLSFGGLYHEFALSLLKGLHTNEVVSRLAANLLGIAEHAYALRQFDVVDSVSHALLKAPLPSRYQNIGLFYKALSMNRGGRGNPDRARAIFERVGDEGTPLYRAKAMLALGTSSARTDDRTALSFYREAVRILSCENIFDPLTTVYVSQMTAIARAKDGDHVGAVADLERLLPFARATVPLQPFVYHNHLNSLAFELGEVGRLEEARSVSQAVVASPFALVYPEWRATLDDIESKTNRRLRSVVAVSQVPSEGRDSPGQLISWPGDSERRGNSTSPCANNSARIVNLHDWKKKLEKKSNGNTQKRPSLEQIRSMTLEEKQATITRYVYGDQVTDEMLDSILQVTLAPETAERDEV